MRLQRLTLALGALSTLAVFACNSVPVAAPETTFTLKVQERTGQAERVKIDFLWMIDNSTSMCEEQVSLTQNFKVFTDTLTTSFNIDARVAVTTADAQCDPNLEGLSTAKGVFNKRWATDFPPPCFAKQIKECKKDEDCEEDPDDPDDPDDSTDEGKWACNRVQLDSCVENPNRTTNTSCRYRCDNDQDCRDKFGSDDYECAKPSGNPDDYGCVQPPQTDSCTGDTSIVTTENLSTFPCIATTGVNQEQCFEYEQGLRTALEAVDPNGPNLNQLRDSGGTWRFLRPDAYLVIIFVSDEDDCSVFPGSPGFPFEKHNTCALERTTEELDDDGNPGILVPVSYYVNKFKSLKNDPTRVIIAAIAGDALLEPDPVSGNHTLPICSDLDVSSCLDSHTVSCTDEAQAACDALRCTQDDIDNAASGDDCFGGAVDDSTQASTNCEDDLEDDVEDCIEVQCEEPLKQICADDWMSTFFADMDNPTEEEIIAYKRALYIDSKGAKKTCYHKSYACSSPAGVADFGSRYYELARGFGSQGLFTNICAASGFENALEQIAQMIIRVINRVCLPKPIKPEDLEFLEVRRVAPDGTETQVTVFGGPEADFQNEAFEDVDEYLFREVGGEICEQDGEVRPAVQFRLTPSVGEELIVTYKGDPLIRL